MVISKRIRPYSVMVKWNDEVVGSGILVKSKDNKCYLFTARHLFKTGDDKNFKKVKEFRIKKKLNQISINRESFTQEIFVDKILYFEDDLDLIVFSLKEEPPIEHLPIIKILKNDHQTQKYHFYGYPKGAKNLEGKHTGNPEYAQYVQSNEEENHVFRLSATKNIGGDAVSGYSGSGIFVESKEKIKIDNDELIENSVIYLVGILIRAKEGLSYYEGVDLSEIIDDINDKANIEIPTIEDAIDIKLTPHIETKILKRNSEDNFIQQIERLNKNDDKNLLKDFLDNSENELAEMTRKLADFYLLGGMLYKDNNYEEFAKKYFRLATKFNPRYKRYEKGYKGKNIEIEKTPEEEKEDIINYYHDGIISFQHKDYDEAEKAFLEHLKKEDIKDFEKLESYKYLSKIYEKRKDLNQTINYFKETLPLYKNSFEKLEAYYKLAQFYKKEDNTESLGYIELGLNLLENELLDKDKKNKNPEVFLDFKWKLEDLRDKLEEKDNDKIINSTLIKLVKQNPEKYMDKFLEEYLKTQNGEITSEIIYQKLEDLHRDVKSIKK